VGPPCLARGLRPLAEAIDGSVSLPSYLFLYVGLPLALILSLVAGMFLYGTPRYRSCLALSALVLASSAVLVVIARAAA
jgi:hypothetical protein